MTDVNDIPRRKRRFLRREEKKIINNAYQKSESLSDEIPIGLSEELFNQMDELAEREKQKIKAEKLADKKVKEFKRKNKRYPNKDELDEISDSIYSQLKIQEQRDKIKLELKQTGLITSDTDLTEENPVNKKRLSFRERMELRKKEKAQKESNQIEKEKTEKEDSPNRISRRSRIKRGKTPVQEELPEPQENKLEALGVKDLLGDLENETSEEKGNSLDLDLPDFEKELSTGTEVSDELNELENLNDDLPIDDSNKKIKCPNCGTTVKKTIFCPQCGTEYCENCAASKETIAGQLKVTCPKCGKQRTLRN